MIYKREVGYPNLAGLMQKLEILPPTSTPNRLARVILKQAVFDLGKFGKPVIGSVVTASESESERIAFLDPRVRWESDEKYQETTMLIPISRNPATPSMRELPTPIFDTFVQVTPQEVADIDNRYGHAFQYAARTAVTMGTAITEHLEIPGNYFQMQVNRSVLQEVSVGTLEMQPAAHDWRISMAWDGDTINIDDIDFSEGGLGVGPKPFGNMGAIYEAVVGAGEAVSKLRSDR